MKHFGLTTWLIIFYSLFSGICSSAPYIETREAYNTASDKHELALRTGYGFDNNAGIMYTSAYNTNRISQFKSTYNELEGWYPIYKPNSSITFQMGGLINSSKEGSGVSIYSEINNKFSDYFNVSMRYRYNHKNYETLNNLGCYKQNNTHQFIMYWNYKINDYWSYTFEPDYYITVNDFNQKNGKEHSWELNNKLTYLLSQNLKPYLELSWLDRWINYSSEQYRIRVGIRYYF